MGSLFSASCSNMADKGFSRVSEMATVHGITSKEAYIYLAAGESEYVDLRGAPALTLQKCVQMNETSYTSLKDAMRRRLERLVVQVQTNLIFRIQSLNLAFLNKKNTIYCNTKFR